MLLAISLHQTPASIWAAVAVVVGLIFLHVCGAKFKWLWLGEDQRTSTSKVQALLWTLLLAWALLTLTLQDKTGFNLVPDYLALLGFPALALVFAKALVQQKLEQGDIAKSPPASDKPNPAAAKVEQAQAAVSDAKVTVTAAAATADPQQAVATAEQAIETTASAANAASAALATNAGESKRGAFSYIGDLVNNDAGKPDIADFQYVVFNLVAATFFIFNFVDHDLLPNIPSTLLALTGASAGTYVANKALLNQKPVLTGVTPASASPNEGVTLKGTNLVSQGTDPNGTSSVTEVKFDTVSVAPERAEDSGIRVIVPVGSNFADYEADKEKHVHISVMNAAGLESNQVPFTISPRKT